jgi:hypothetical protein
MITEFNSLKKGDRVKTNRSGMATVVETGCYSGKMVKLNCDVPKWCCPYFFEDELDLTYKSETDESCTRI